jgi:bifunctional DNA-binding transcriptional regulator/antitoxin component of YhaV-PrlF toxin-antitoxin module
MNQHLSGTKIAERLFSRAEGATMEEVVAATGGRQHNLLERLKARGYTVRTRKEGRTTRYWAKPPATSSFAATVTAKGQVTIPQEVRARLGMGRTGGKIRFVVETVGRVEVVRGTGTIEDLFGILGKPPRRLTLEQIEEGIVEAAVERGTRGLRPAKR